MSPSSKNLRGEWLVLAAAVLWGTTGTSQALAPEAASPLAIGVLRLAVGGTTMLLIAILNGSLSRHLAWPLGETLLAGAFVAGYQICFFAGVDAAGVAVGTIVGIGSAPVLTGALGWLLFKEKPGLRWSIATATAILGCILLALSGEKANFNPWGIVLALGAGLFYAGYAHISKRLLERLPSDAVMAALFFLGAIFLSPALLWVNLSWLGEPRGMAVTLHLGLITTAAANFLFGRGLKLVPTAHAVSLSLAEPLTAGLLGVFLLGEALNPVAWAGVFLLFAGLVLLAR